MVPLVSFLAALRILTEAQICNNGEGKVVFEKVIAFQSTPQEFLTNSSQYEIITRTNIPPLKVLEDCFHRCQEDKVNKIAVCNKFDFLPGKRLPEQSNLKKRTPKNANDMKGKLSNEYDQSSCVLYNQVNGSINWNEISNNYGSVWQFEKVCLSAQHINKNCPNRPFVYEKISSYKLIHEQQGKEMIVTDKYECENKCLIEKDFTCRSASYKPSENKCFLSPFNRHVAPSKFQRDPDFEYLENMCLKNNEMCKWNVLIIETKKQWDPIHEKHSTRASSVNNCSTSCLDSLDKYGFVCRSFMFDEQTQQCILYDEDLVNKASNANISDSKLIPSNGNLYRVLCSTNDKDKELDNKTLECYRHKRLRGKHQMEIYALNFYDCLTGCMKKFQKNCRSIEYSYKQKICRFSTGTVVGPVSDKDIDALIDDEHFDYYQFMWNDEFGNGQPYPSSSSLNDRQDAIETSYSQPGNYKNFILPSEKARDHHRGGLAYNKNDQPFHQQTNRNNPSYTYKTIEQKQLSTDNYDQTSLNKPEKSESDSNSYQTNQIYNGQKLQQAGFDSYSRTLPIYNIPQQSESDFINYDRTNKIYPISHGPSRQTEWNQYDRSSPISNKASSYYNVHRPLSQTNIVYPSPTYTYHVEPKQQLDTDNQTPAIHYNPRKPNSDPNEYDRTSQIQSQIYPVPNHSQSQIYNIPYKQSQPDTRDFKLSPTQAMTLSSKISQNRVSFTTSGKINESNPQNTGFSIETHHRSPSIQYPGQAFVQNYGYPMPRTPMGEQTGGNFPINNFENHTRFMSYGPYGTMPYVNLSPYSNIKQTQMNPIPAVAHSTTNIGYNLPTQIAYDRYGQLSLGSSGSRGNGITSNGCKYDSNLSGSVQFKKMGFSARLKSKHIYKVARAERLEDCERYCLETKDFKCKSFNFRPFFPDNCELSNVDTKKFKLDDPNHFEHNTQFDYYERDEQKTHLMMANSMDCFEVLQTCSPEGMELKLKTPEGFYGRIYTYGFYDSCFFDGNGGTTSVLKISKPNGFPRCGTQQINPDAMTNIVVVQFNDFVQTSRDKKYNLTCYISGPGEAVVTSNYLDTKTDGRHPMQIEHLPAQNILTSNIILRILYRGTPTNTIVVGDLLTFRLEARNQYRFNGYYNDIFASNVIAKDPYTGRQVLLIDSKGCPVDLYVFPELHKTPDGALEAEFYAFKIPDSNFLVFQATVKTCKGPCEPVICKERSRGQAFSQSTKGNIGSNSYMDFPSWGRRKRSLSRTTDRNKKKVKDQSSNKIKDEEEVHELLRVYLSPEDVPESQMLQRPPEPLPIGKICIDKGTYYLLFTFSILFFLLFIIILPYYVLVKWMKSRDKDNKKKVYSGWISKWPRQMSSLMMKPKTYKKTTTVTTLPNGVYRQGQRTFQHLNDFHHSLSLSSRYNEPVYQDTVSSSAIERSRSLQSLTVQDQINNK